MVIDYSEDTLYFGQMRTQPGSSDKFGQYGKFFLSNNSYAYGMTIRENINVTKRSDILSMEVTSAALVLLIRFGDPNINTGACRHTIGLFNKTDGFAFYSKHGPEYSQCWMPG